MSTPCKRAYEQFFSYLTANVSSNFASVFEISHIVAGWLPGSSYKKGGGSGWRGLSAVRLNKSSAHAGMLQQLEDAHLIRELYAYAKKVKNRICTSFRFFVSFICSD